MSELTDYQDSSIEIEDFQLEGYEPEPETVVPPSGVYMCTIPVAKMVSSGMSRPPAGLMFFEIKEVLAVMEKDTNGELLPAPELGSRVLFYTNFDSDYRAFIERFLRIAYDLLGPDLMSKSTKQLYHNIQQVYENQQVKVKFRREPEKNPPRTADGQLVGELRYFVRVEKVIPPQGYPSTDDIPF